MCFVRIIFYTNLEQSKNYKFGPQTLACEFTVNIHFTCILFMPLSFMLLFLIFSKGCVIIFLLLLLTQHICLWWWNFFYAPTFVLLWGHKRIICKGELHVRVCDALKQCAAVCPHSTLTGKVL